MKSYCIVPAVLVSAALLAAGCAHFPASGRAAPGAPNSATPGPSDGWSSSRLYARDGSVVGAADAAAMEARTAAPRELASADGGRMYVLELYQKAIDERDALHGELTALRAELRTVQEALIASDSELDAADATLEQLRAENKRLLDENVDLAARLTTAQIRRLQVEKLLLELRLEELKLLQAAAGANEPPAGGERRPR